MLQWVSQLQSCGYNVPDSSLLPDQGQEFSQCCYHLTKAVYNNSYSQSTCSVQQNLILIKIAFSLRWDKSKWSLRTCRLNQLISAEMQTSLLKCSSILRGVPPCKCRPYMQLLQLQTSPQENPVVTQLIVCDTLPQALAAVHTCMCDTVCDNTSTLVGYLPWLPSLFTDQESIKAHPPMLGQYAALPPQIITWCRINGVDVIIISYHWQAHLILLQLATCGKSMFRYITGILECCYSYMWEINAFPVPSCCCCSNNRS